ncbi:hypothetical protein [Microvirga antarctica]|uniref:hypothetical protein n=1 Tax=Microvirga antarctica TaxID=2819233 RepID=UPI001B30CD01|nr:hypothetical protein [Microvirga antarctica]
MAWLQFIDSGDAPVCVNMTNIISFTPHKYGDKVYTRLMAIGQNSESLKIITVKDSMDEILAKLKAAGE